MAGFTWSDGGFMVGFWLFQFLVMAGFMWSAVGFMVWFLVVSISGYGRLYVV